MKITKSEFDITVKALQRKLKGEDLVSAIQEFVDENEIFDGDTKMEIDVKSLLTPAEQQKIDTSAIEGAISKAIEGAVTKGFEAAGKRPFNVEVHDNAEDDKKWGFKSMGQFGLYVVHKTLQASGQPHDNVLVKSLGDVYTKAATTYANEAIGADGGVLLPPDFRQEIWQAVAEQESIMGMTDMGPTNSNAVEMSADETTPWSTTGVQAYWRGEGQSTTQTKLALQPRTTRLNELMALLPASNELLQDAPRLNTYLQDKAPQKIGWKVDEAIFRGTGAGQPLGFLNASYGGLVTVAKDTSQTAATISVANLLNMRSRLLSKTRVKAIQGAWFYNTDIIPQLGQLYIGNYPVFLPRITEDSPDRILGMPAYPSEHCKTLGTAGDIVLTDLKGGYACFHKANGIDFQSSIHLFFDTAQTAFRWIFRVGGQPYLAAPVTPPNSSNTKSHFVTLATRA